ncbi:hypothetical protein T265_02712 [Opisthorchis viverrini]|uniref:Uncharacterized protein n=1 Tax=Opisthorchis viverrini TaxID=6198 RepID=A0A074ZUS8_OPIVI|nr:hypothetical protein T265_02712 [Opisthorchis viverrini]KER30896.1 hypothetical protein T265_02712 [Opisthorchis viverrini]
MRLHHVVMATCICGIASVSERTLGCLCNQLGVPCKLKGLTREAEADWVVLEPLACHTGPTSGLDKDDHKGSPPMRPVYIVPHLQIHM